MRYLRSMSMLVILVAASISARPDTVKLKCTADTNISSYSSEQRLNYGASSRIRLKGIEMLGLFQFDTAPIAGWTVRSATLYLRYAGADRKLRTLGVSTISAPWKEGTGSAEAKPDSATFLTSGTGLWAGPSTDFTDVSFTAGNTLASYADIALQENDWFSVHVDAKIVQAMVAGVTYGVAVSDEKGQTMANNDVYSREQAGSEPYLVVEGEKLAPRPPGDLQTVTVMSDPMHADFQSGAVAMSILTPPGTFSYEVSESTGPPAHLELDEVDRFRIPFATPTKLQQFYVDRLDPKQPVEFIVTPIGTDGTRGKPSSVRGAASPAKPEPGALTAPARKIELSALARPGGVQAFVYPDTDKASPINGCLLEEVGELAYSAAPQSDFQRRNAVWDGKNITLSGARGEILGFQILVDRGAQESVRGVFVTAPKTMKGAGGNTFSPKIALYRDWYVNSKGWYPEACIPLNGSFDIPTADNKIPGQHNQSIFVDFRIPAGAPQGEYDGAFTVSRPGAAGIILPVRLTVNSLTLPDKLSFDISLNTYGTFGGAFGLNDSTPEYRVIEREYHRFAYMHRSTLAPLGYSHSGNITTNYAPPVEGVGANMHVTDWSTWDRQFGAYLDGSAFADLPRKGVPLSHLYLPFHEAWPVDIRKHYTYTQTVFEYPAMIAEHALKAQPIEKATDQELREGFRAIAAQFAAHFKEKGWTHTMFQFYENDKYYYKDPKMGGRGTSWWLLDEPNHRDDWLVLAFFNRLFDEGTGKTSGVNFVKREDISRPQWQRDYLDGLVDVMCVSSELFTKGPRLREMHEKLGVNYWNYGSANSVNRSNTEAEAWAIRAYLAGADAIVPWQSIGEDKNFDEAEDTALILPGVRFGLRGPIASLRLKALRRAQQDVEYLVLLAKQKGWDREQVAASLRDILSLKMTTVKANDNDAGSYQFSPKSADVFDDVRRAAAAELHN